MIIKQLTRIEDELYSSVIELIGQPVSPGNRDRLNLIIRKYKDVHREYSQLSLVDNEALKRGLFIQWYALTEPSFLTGIGDIDLESANRIIIVLQDILDNNKADSELLWMLNYYANWEWCFDHLESFKGFDPRIVNEQNNHLPQSIDKEGMRTRGQMGKYWNSLTIFN
jgi:hypothetical protein